MVIFSSKNPIFSSKFCATFIEIEPWREKGGKREKGNEKDHKYYAYIYLYILPVQLIKRGTIFCKIEKGR